MLFQKKAGMQPMISIGYGLSRLFLVVNKFICREWLPFVGQFGKLETKLVLRRNRLKIMLKSFFYMFFYALLGKALPRRGTTCYK
jgi:hypothetical protein